MTLHDVQVYLDREGASDLVAELVMKSSTPYVFMEAVQLGIALLEGGNPVIQRSLYMKLQSAETSPIFFKVFHDKMREAQAEIRSTMSVITTELAAGGGKTDDKDKNRPSGKQGMVHYVESLDASITNAFNRRKLGLCPCSVRANLFTLM